MNTDKTRQDSREKAQESQKNNMLSSRLRAFARNFLSWFNISREGAKARRKAVLGRITLLAGFSLLVFLAGGCGPRLPQGVYSTEDELPLIKLSGKSTEVATWQYLGSWFLTEQNKKTPKKIASWRDAVRLNFEEDKETFQIDASVSMLRGTESKRLTAGAEAGVFKKITWQDRQMSVFAFRVLASAKQVAVAEIDADNSIALYVNQKLARETSAADNVELGTHLLIPVNIEAGENIIVAKVLSNGGPPRFRMSVTLDQSKDFQAAWNGSWGLLTKLLYNKTGDSFETPAVRWDPLLERMTIGAEVSDALTGRVLLKRDALKNKSMIRGQGSGLGEGVYKISYKSHQSREGEADEYFIVGSPRAVNKTVSETLARLPWDADEKLNIEAQSIRADILLEKKSYNPENKEWQEKIAWTLGSLANWACIKTKTAGNIFKGLPGLQFRGFVSKIDNSRQFYRLFVPADYTAGKPLPMLLILPTTIAATDRPFLESPPAAAQRKAVQVCKFAEKYGFAVLWPGYPNASKGWTRESVHAEEALEDVEKNYAIDGSRISLYGLCSAGFYSARLASIYPNRFAAIVYDRAIFERDSADADGESRSMAEWLYAINPTNSIIENRNLKILVLNDGTTPAGHGIMALTNRFLKRALAKRDDIKYALDQRKTGFALWDSVFEFLSRCENKRPNHDKVDIPAKSGYAGPMAEVFATPFIVVEGTRIKPEEAKLMDGVIANLKAQYREQFFGADFILKKDIEVTDEDVERYSLALVGNAESNAVWGRMAAKYADELTPYKPKDDWSASPAKDVFAEVFKNPANKNNYLLLIGSNESGNMAFLRDFNPFKACFDCYVYKYQEGHEKEYIIARRP